MEYDLDLDLDIIFNHIDDLYWDGKLKEIDLILSQVSGDLPLTLLVGFLTITMPHKEQFVHRDKIFDIIRKVDPERPQLWKPFV